MNKRMQSFNFFIEISLAYTFCLVGLCPVSIFSNGLMLGGLMSGGLFWPVTESKISQNALNTLSPFYKTHKITSLRKT